MILSIGPWMDLATLNKSRLPAAASPDGGEMDLQEKARRIRAPRDGCKEVVGPTSF
jgi:hypothetical protein